MSVHILALSNEAVPLQGKDIGAIVISPTRSLYPLPPVISCSQAYMHQHARNSTYTCTHTITQSHNRIHTYKLTHSHTYALTQPYQYTDTHYSRHTNILIPITLAIDSNSWPQRARESNIWSVQPSSRRHEGATHPRIDNKPKCTASTIKSKFNSSTHINNKTSNHAYQ